MQFLNAEQCAEWCRDLNRPLEAASGSPRPPVEAGVRFATPTDAGKRVALARVLWELLPGSSPDRLIWVTEFGIWPSGECRPMVEFTRRGLAANIPLSDTPGHLARIGESDEGLSVLTLACLSFWDCWVFAGASPYSLFLSHDEYGYLWCSKDTEFEAALRSLDQLGVAATMNAA